MFNNVYKGKKVLVTGHTGFKGTWLAIWLKKLGADVIGYSLGVPTEPSMYKICSMNNEVINIIGDIKDDKKLQKVFQEENPDIVFHLAAQPLVRLSYKEPKLTYETNIMGTVNVLEQARHTKSVKAVVVITTDKCYENKEWVYGYRETDAMGGYDPYSSSKGCAELVTSSYRNSFYRQQGIALASARAGNVIGGGDWAEDRLIPDFVRAVIQNMPIEVRNPLATRPWQHVLEPLSGYLWLAALMVEDCAKYSGGWNFGPNDSDIKNVEDILSLAVKCWGAGSIEVNKDEQPHEANLLKLDISKAAATLKWHPVYNANTAISKTVEWYKKYYNEENPNMYNYTLGQIDEYELNAKKLELEWTK